MSKDLPSWYVAAPNKPPSGPFTVEEVVKAWKDGLGATTLCWREGMAEWLPLAQVEPFAEVIGRARSVNRFGWKVPLIAIGAAVCFAVLCTWALSHARRVPDEPNEAAGANALAGPGSANEIAPGIPIAFANRPDGAMRLARPTVVDGEAAEEALRYWKLTKLGDSYFIYDGHYNGLLQRDMSETTISEMRQVRMEVQMEPIAEADKLNATDWKGTVQLKCAASTLR